jgi:hypothetical protein
MLFKFFDVLLLYFFLNAVFIVNVENDMDNRNSKEGCFNGNLNSFLMFITK